MCEAALSGFGVITGAVAGYVAKQAFIVYELNVVREELSQCVAAVARRYFGSFAAQALGYGVGVSLALPVANFIGDLIWTSISEGVNAMTFLLGRSFGLYKDAASWMTTQLKLAARIVSIAIGYFAKCLVVCYVMPYSNQTVLKIAAVITPTLCNSSWGNVVLTPISFLLATSCAPTLTGVLADVTSFVVQKILYAAAEYAIDNVT